LFQPLSTHSVGGLHCCLNGIPTDGAQYLIGNGLVRSQTSERNAPVLAVVDLGASALVSHYDAAPTCVGDVQHAATTPATQ
jgi:hypothetical protein